MAGRARARWRPPVTASSLARSLLIVGDQWSLLIIREAFLHARRFNDWKQRLGLSDTVLAQRLRDLVSDGVLRTEPSADRPTRFEYRLTEAGQDLWPVFVAIWTWEVRWAERRPGQRPPRLVHDVCGHEIAPVLGCRACGVAGVTPRLTNATRRPGATFEQANPARRYRRAAARPGDGAAHVHPDLMELLGDRWNTSVLGAAMLGVRRFGEFQRELAIPSLILTDRLSAFVANGVMAHVPISADAKRKEYRLAPKGADIFPVFATIIAWGNRWFADDPTPVLQIDHVPCGNPFIPMWVCNACGRTLELPGIHYEI